MAARLTPQEVDRLIGFVSHQRGADLTPAEAASVINWALLVRAQARRLDAILRLPAARAIEPC